MYSQSISNNKNLQSQLKAEVDIPVLKELGVSASFAGQYIKSHQNATGEDVLKAHTTSQFEKIANNKSLTPQQKMKAMNNTLVSDTKSWHNRIVDSGSTYRNLHAAGSAVNYTVDFAAGTADAVVMKPIANLIGKFDPQAGKNLNDIYANSSKKGISNAYNDIP
jgi:hypothetical protein